MPFNTRATWPGEMEMEIEEERGEREVLRLVNKVVVAAVKVSFE